MGAYRHGLDVFGQYLSECGHAACGARGPNAEPGYLVCSQRVLDALGDCEPEKVVCRCQYDWQIARAADKQLLMLDISRAAAVAAQKC